MIDTLAADASACSAKKRGPLDLPAWIEHCILDLRPEPEQPVPVALPAQALANVSEKGRVSASLQHQATVAEKVWRNEQPRRRTSVIA